MILRFQDPEDHRWIIGTSCRECMVDVSADDLGWVGVGLLSSHAGAYATTLIGRVRWAWQILRGRAWTDVNLTNRKQVDELIAALEEARDLAFPA
jgi:hypothetical protein